MKKMLYSLLVLAMAGAGCSKEPAGSELPAVGAGDHRLESLSATLDHDDPQTRTSLGNNQVVYWSNNDRIAVVNLKTNTIYQYVLVSGSGTSVGKFEPVNVAAAFDNIDDIKAVYPAIAATVADGKISFSINKEYTEAERAKYGITSWTNNASAYAFTHNDIKVSYNTSMKTTDDAAADVNFKFRQLGTWCNFVFNFTGIPEHKLENMESLTVTTADGTKKISGVAEVDLTDPNKPILKEGTETAVEWITTGSLNSATLTKSMMLFPCIDGDKLKITVKTNMNTFIFYATPTQPLTAGTILRFPIDVGVNFEKDNAATAENFTYQVVPAEIEPFYYYGDTNCLLLAGTTAAGTLDVTPYKTNPYYWNVKDDAAEAAKPAAAKVIWRESGITSMAEPTVTHSNGKYTLNISGVQGYGNALIGIYESTDAETPLWSYHVWKPEFDPRTELLEYKYTNSGTYYVMPIALGATNKVDIGPTGTATANTLKTYGLYYQWGRKDPLGRPNALVSPTGLVTTYAGATGTNSYALLDKKADINTLLGGNDVSEKDGKAVERWMLEYVTKYPTQFITISENVYNYSWTGQRSIYLWGNPQGYTYPRKSTLHRSIFDPCPKGYRVAPIDLYISFTQSGLSSSANVSSEERWAENLFNIANRQPDNTWPTTKNITTMTTQRGYFFCYGVNDDDSKKWQEGPTDFYPASGIRACNSGNLSVVGSYGYSWSSSPYGSNDVTVGGLGLHSSGVDPIGNHRPSYAFPLRCVREN